MEYSAEVDTGDGSVHVFEGEEGHTFAMPPDEWDQRGRPQVIYLSVVSSAPIGPAGAS